MLSILLGTKRTEHNATEKMVFISKFGMLPDNLVAFCSKHQENLSDQQSQVNEVSVANYTAIKEKTKSRELQKDLARTCQTWN